MDSLAKIKNLWPDIQLARKENFQKPTSSSVLQFYSHFLIRFYEFPTFYLLGEGSAKVPFTNAGYQHDANIEVSTEESVCLEMQKFNEVFGIAGLKFVLADIYQPTFIRTKHFVSFCMHLLQYCDTILTNFETITGNLLKMVEQSSRLLSEKDEILSEISTYTIHKAQLIEDKDNLKDNCTEIKKSYEKYCNERSEKERVIQEQLKELERLKIIVDEKTASKTKLEDKERQYIEEVITEEEYSHLKKLDSDLRHEKDYLNVECVNMEDELSHGNDILNHLRDCRKLVPDSIIKEHVEKQIIIEAALEDFNTKEEKLMLELKSRKALQAYHKKILNEVEVSNTMAKSENKIILKNIQQESEELSMKVHNQREEIINCNKRVLLENQELHNKITEETHTLEILQNHIVNEHNDVIYAEQMMIQKFKDHLKDCLQ